MACVSSSPRRYSEYASRFSVGCSLSFFCTVAPMATLSADVTFAAMSLCTANTSLRTQSFDAVLSDVFAVQSDIAAKVTSALNVAMGATVQKKLSEQPTENLEAYSEYLRGEELTQAMGNNDPKVLAEAKEHYLA